MLQYIGGDRKDAIFSGRLAIYDLTKNVRWGMDRMTQGMDWGSIHGLMGINMKKRQKGRIWCGDK
ncbi:hypothetical protein AGMMS49949_00990 [Alphaproteobacteria bacterium]|nr:hypothetical protein AGMMS49949_00990 [Alphaproteobacteria bacterium]GHS95954.1 hypothetical protein AGMMS50296_1550 [Alphaproteobacteria bacterium]